jgi:hypothetical protein
VDIAKIDRLFVGTLDANSRDASIVGGIVQLTHALFRRPHDERLSGVGPGSIRPRRPERNGVNEAIDRRRPFIKAHLRRLCEVQSRGYRRMPISVMSTP